MNIYVRRQAFKIAMRALYGGQKGAIKTKPINRDGARHLVGRRPNKK